MLREAQIGARGHSKNAEKGEERRKERQANKQGTRELVEPTPQKSEFEKLFMMLHCMSKMLTNENKALSKKFTNENRAMKEEIKEELCVMHEENAVYSKRQERR